MNLTGEQQQKMELLKLQARFRLKLLHAFDARDVNSVPTGDQLAILQSKKNINYVIGSNRCLAEGTLVMTPRGPIEIELLSPGDTVYNEHGDPIQVLKTFDQGVQEVVALTHYGRTWAECTDNHVWAVTTNKGTNRTTTTEDIIKKRSRNYYSVNRKEVDIPLGSKDVPDAYALGAFIGDGCSLQSTRNIQISSKDNVIPLRISEILGVNFKKLHPTNYTYELKTGTDSVSFYSDWCYKRYAHQKTICLDEVKTWNRKSVLKLLAGLVDTDGSVYVQPDGIVLSCGMQAEKVIDFVEWAFLALWQIQVPRHLDNRDRYKNGPVHCVTLKNRHQCARAIKELDPYIVTASKKWDPSWDELDRGKFNPAQVGLQAGTRRKIRCYDIHVAGRTNLYLLANGLVTHNSGKSGIGSRALSWFFENNHPYIERPEVWGDGPLTILLVGRVGEQMETELWGNKLEPFLEPGSYKVVKAGSAIARVEHKTNGNKIVFISHHDAETAREKAQAYTAHVVWVDEMPTKVGIMNELRARVLDSDGYLYATFTPLLKNTEIVKIVDTPSKRAKKWFISVLDNPKFAKKDRQEIIDEFRAMSASESEFNARLYGKWMTMESSVFLYDAETNFTFIKEYDPYIWPHVAVVDPAASGTAGLTVWAREPRRDVWYCVLAKYVKGSAFSKMVPEIEDIISRFNVIKRICDCNPSAFYIEAGIQNIKYYPITEKSFNKENMIDACNTALAEQRMFLTPGSETLADELVSCTRSEINPDRIVNASKYHTADTFRYFVALKPTMKEQPIVPKPEERVRQAWKNRLQSQSDSGIITQTSSRRHTSGPVRTRMSRYKRQSR